VSSFNIGCGGLRAALRIVDFQLLESAPDAMVVVDAEGRIVFVNGQTEALLGYARTELLNQPLELLLPSRFRDAHRMHRGHYAQAAHPRPMGGALELYALKKDGVEVPVEISLSPIIMGEGLFVASAIRDVTERKKAEHDRARLIEERAMQAETDRLKDEFLATLSHELRTPLNAILGWTAMLKGGSIAPEQVPHALDTIERNARAQSRLVETLLDASRVVTGKLHLDVAPVDLAQLVDAAVDVVRPGAHAKRITLELTIEQRPLLLLADVDRMQQAIWNLLANAVKFTPPNGRIEISVRLCARSVILAVRDTGHGIDPAFLPHVFDRFRQEDNSLTRAYDGLGLGLTITRSIVEGHGGTVRAASPGPEKGSTFSIELPLVQGIEQQHATSPAAHVEAVNELAGLRIVVVDDVADERELLAAIFVQHGGTVETADSVRAALPLVRTSHPDVVVTDIAMPVEDGYVLLRELRTDRDPGIASVPVVAVTAQARTEEARRAIAAGFDHYISKPVEVMSLPSIVAALVSRDPEKRAALLK
jgi:PAS domain S-box-containing protein